jgi:hypothetical protein
MSTPFVSGEDFRCAGRRERDGSLPFSVGQTRFHAGCELAGRPGGPPRASVLPLEVVCPFFPGLRHESQGLLRLEASRLSIRTVLCRTSADKPRA